MDLPMCPTSFFDFISNMADSEGRRLCDLRVIDLRTELEKRNLDKSGVKVVLLDRLEKVLKEEGHDPETFLFDPITMEKKTPVKRTARSGSTAEGELDDSVDDVNVDEMVVKDEVVDDDADAEIEKDASDNGDKQAVADDIQRNIKEEFSKEVPVKKREASETSEEPSAKKVCKEEPSVKTEHPAGGKRTSEINGMDTEDSINLDIGEDELLNEEGDGRLKVSKDGAGGAAPAEDGTGQEPQDGAAPQDPADSTAAQDSAAVDSAKSAADTKSTSASAEGDKGAEEKDSKKSSSSVSSRNLWVSGLSGATRAKDLKMLCSRHGKVVGAKVVTNARTPGSRCYGYVTMVSAQDADACIKHLHRTELHGRMISVEKAKSELGAGGWGAGSWPAGNRPPRTPRRQDKIKGEGDTKEGEGKETKVKEGGEKKEGESEVKEGDRPDGEGAERKDLSKGDSQETKRKARERSGRKERAPHRRGLGAPRAPRDDVLSFSKIRKEREVQRERERLRRARSEERRRRVAEQALRDQERRQRMEKQRLALEREKLRVERERIEREKNELHRIERERQKLEREKLEFERLELKRAQMKLDEERRAKRGYAYPSGSSPPWSKQGGAYDTSRGVPPKRPAFGSQGAAPPPPHFGDTATAAPAPAYERSAPPAATADKREGRDRERRGEYTRHAAAGGNSSSAMKYQSNGSSYESRQPLPPGTRPREQRYETGAGGRSDRYSGAEGGRGGRSPKPASRDHRYPESTTASKEYDRQGSSWHGGGSGSTAKGGFPSAPPSWSKPGESWSSTGVSGERGGYSGGGGGYPNEVRYPLHQPAPPGSQVAGPFPDARYTSQREYRKY